MLPQLDTERSIDFVVVRVAQIAVPVMATRSAVRVVRIRPLRSIGLRRIRLFGMNGTVSTRYRHIASIGSVRTIESIGLRAIRSFGAIRTVRAIRSIRLGTIRSFGTVRSFGAIRSIRLGTIWPIGAIGSLGGRTIGAVGTIRPIGSIRSVGVGTIGAFGTIRPIGSIGSIRSVGVGTIRPIGPLWLSRLDATHSIAIDAPDLTRELVFAETPPAIGESPVVQPVLPLREPIDSIDAILRFAVLAGDFTQPIDARLAQCVIALLLA